MKIYIITDMEGVDGIFDFELQCLPDKSPRWPESRKLLTEEVNAAVDGLLQGGATEVVVWDGHWDGDNLSVLDIHPKARLLTGTHKAFDLDPSYSALIFIGQHAIRWEIGLEVMHAGSYGIPAIMLSGDTAACKEIADLIPKVECAEVKSGVSRSAGLMLPHPVACALIREKARRAIERLPEFKPYKVSGPVDLKVEYTNVGEAPLKAREGFDRVDDRTWIVHGKDFMDAYARYVYH